MILKKALCISSYNFYCIYKRIGHMHEMMHFFLKSDVIQAGVIQVN